MRVHSEMPFSPGVPAAMPWGKAPSRATARPFLRVRRFLAAAGSTATPPRISAPVPA